jgi:hypothetical protein
LDRMLLTVATIEGCCQCEQRSGSIEWLTELPVDNVLRDFLTANGLSMPANFALTDDPKTSQALVAALVSDPAGAVRDPVCGGVGSGLIVRRARYYTRLSASICPMQRSKSSRCFVTVTLLRLAWHPGRHRRCRPRKLNGGCRRRFIPNRESN